MAKYNQNFFQIPQGGVEATWPTTGNPQMREPGRKMSNFGALEFGTRSSSDYTKVVNGFKDKHQNPNVPPFTMDGDYMENPFVWGSTTKRAWHDELRIMTLGARTMAGDRLPMMDVMDTKLSAKTPKDGDMPLNWPKEGYKPFGGRVAGPFNYRPSK